MRNLKLLAVGLSLLSLAGPSFATDMTDALAAAKSSYTANVTAIKSTYTPQIDPLKAQIADLSLQRTGFRDQKKAITESRKLSRAQITEQSKLAKQLDCRDPKAAARLTASTEFTAAKLACGSSSTKYLSDGTVNPDYTACVATATAAKEAAYATAAATCEACYATNTANKEAARAQLDSEIGWTVLVSDIEALNAQIAPLREQVGALKDAMSAELEPINTAYAAQKAAINAGPYITSVFASGTGSWGGSQSNYLDYSSCNGNSSCDVALDSGGINPGYWTSLKVSVSCAGGTTHPYTYKPGEAVNGQIVTVSCN